MIGIISYECAHKKTTEIIERCSNKIDCIFTIPFKQRSKRKVLINHRPDQFDGHTTKEIGKSYSIDVLPLDKINSEYSNSFNQLIVGGSGLLSEFLVCNFKVINAHPGLIPTTRGLDSFKWALYHKEPLGVTIHQINNEVDLGSHIHHSPTLVFDDDDISSLAARHYKNEIDSLCSYILGSLKYKKIQNLDLKDSRMRMSLEFETQLISKFKKYKQWAINEQQKIETKLCL